MNIGHSFLSCAILQVAGVYGDGRKIPGGVEYRTQFRKGRFLNPVQTEVGKEYGALAGLRDWFRGGP